MFPREFLHRLCRAVESLLQKEPSLLELSSPCLIVGDLHGQIFDLLRILLAYGDPSRSRYLFLGDLVDRGEFSIEVVIVVFLMKVIWPSQVFIIRGNHEFSQMCSKCGYLTQMLEVYNFPAYQATLDVFAWLPMAAVIDSNVLCVHGGLGPDIQDLSSIRNLPRVIDDFGNRAVDSLVWSDPSPRVALFEPSVERGSGFVFGMEAVNQFMAATGIELIIRGHQCVEQGFEYSCQGKVLTIFSASNYCGIICNKAAVADLGPGLCPRIRQFEPLPWKKRGEVVFKVAETSKADPTTKTLLYRTRTLPGLLSPARDSLRLVPSGLVLASVLPPGQPPRDGQPGSNPRAAVVEESPLVPPRALMLLKKRTHMRRLSQG
jgi:protein phosphatase